MTKANGNRLSISINGKAFKADEGETILLAARRNGIYIPTLCSFKELAPFGSCRICSVEVEGMRGLPTSCTTPIAEGMAVKTDTNQLKEARLEVLQLLLSEHTSSCLVCGEKDECLNYLGTIRKAGVTTGCRYCPSPSMRTSGHCGIPGSK